MRKIKLNNPIPLKAKSPRSASRIPPYLLLFFLVFNLLTARGVARGMDESVLFTSMTNAWDRHTLAIDELSYLNDPQGNQVGDFGAGNHLYAKLPPGIILFAVLFYGLGSLLSAQMGAVLAALLTNPLLGLLGLVLLYQFLARRFKPTTALLTTLLVGACSDWWFQSRGFGSEIGAGVFLMATLLAADTGHPLLSGAMFGLSILFRPLNVLAFPIWLINVFPDRKPDRAILKKAVFSALVVGIFLIGILLYNYLRFGNPFNFGYVNERFNTPPWLGLGYLFFSPGRSIFLYSPLLLLAIPGAVLWFKTKQRYGYALAAAILIYLLSVAAWHDWHGGWTWGMRLLTPVLPLMAVFCAPAVESLWARKWGRVLVSLLGVCGLAVGAAALLKDPSWAMMDYVFTNRVRFEDTLFSIPTSYLALQLQELRAWTPKDLDALFLKVLVLVLKIPGGR